MEAVCDVAEALGSLATSAEIWKKLGNTDLTVASEALASKLLKEAETLLEPPKAGSRSGRR